MEDAMDDYQKDYVAVQGFSWMMPGMIVQSDHVAVQGLSWMMPLDYYPR